MEEKINQFYTWLDRHPGKRGQVDTTAMHNNFEWPWQLCMSLDARPGILPC